MLIRKVSKAEISAMADIGLSHGTLQSGEARALKGLIEFDRMAATEIMTPKKKVASLANHLAIDEACKAIQEHPYSRIITHESDSENIKGYILRADIQKSFIHK